MANTNGPISGDIQINVSNAEKNLADLRAEADRLSTALSNLDVGTVEYTNVQKQLNTATTQVARAQRSYKVAVDAAAKAQDTAGKAALTASKLESEAAARTAAALRAKTKAQQDANAAARRAANTDPNPGVSQKINSVANPNVRLAKTATTIDEAQAKADAEAAAKLQDLKAEQARATNKQMVADDKAAREQELANLRYAIIEANKERAAEARKQEALDKQTADAEAAAVKSLAAQRAAYRKANNTDANPGVSVKINSAANPNLGLNNKDLNQLSYSLFNVAQSVGVVGAAVTAATGAAVTFGVQYQTAFTQVERTAGITGNAADALQTQLLDLSTTIPVSFTQLSSIASLGAQMGIASDDLAQFSQTTAEYAAVTGVTTDSASKDFGSLFELLNVGSGDFQNLASAVNYVGVNSVATDQEILNMATSIGASTTQAGFLADQTVGLAGALASLRIQPEQARGVILRLFSDFDKAVSTGGKSLQGYAAILGESTDATQKLYKSDPSEFFNRFLKGLQSAQQTSGDLNGTLSTLGITETREVNVLQRLAGNYDTYTKAMSDANQAYTDGTYLSQTYGQVAKTVGAQVQELVNGIQNLLAKAGQSVFPILAPILELVKTIVAGMNLIPAPILAVITVISGLVGVLALVVAGGLVFVGTMGLAGNAMNSLKDRGGQTGSVMAGLRSVINQFTEALGVNTIAAKVNSATIGSIGSAARSSAVGVEAKTVAMEADTVATEGATVASNGFKTALLGIPIVNIIAALSILVPIVISLAGAQDRANDAAKAASAALATAGGGLDGYRAALEKDTAAADGHTKGLTTMKLAVDQQAQAAQDAAAKQAVFSDAVRTATGANTDAGRAVATTNDKLKEQTVVVGDNAKAWVANALAKKAVSDAGDPLAQVFNNANQKAAYEQYGINFGKAIQDGLGKQNGVENAINKQLAAAKANLNSLNQANTQSGITPQQAALIDLIKNLEEAAKAADGLNGQLTAQNAILNGVGATIAGTGDDAADADGAVASLSDQIGKLFAAASDASTYASQMDALNDSIQQNGSSFDLLSAGGIANMQALGSALQSAAAYGADLGIPATDSMAQALASIGGDTDQIIALMRSLASSNPTLYASLNIDDVLAKYQQIQKLGLGTGALSVAADTSNLNRLVAQRDALQTKLKSAQDQQNNSSSNPQAKAEKAAKRSADIAAKNAKAIRDSIKTAAEYAQDIGSAMKEAFDKKFGVQESVDDITTKFSDLRDRIAEAKKKVEDLKISLQKLASDKNILQIQLGVATNYGDTTRAQAIQADLAQNASDTADAQGQLKDAQDAVSTSLIGNTKAAIENRAAVLDLVNAYQAQIQAFAATGASTQQIAAYTKMLQGQFQAQLVQLGFNSKQVLTYSSTFDSLRAAVVKVPTRKSVTITADTSQASSALGAVGSKIAGLSGDLSKLNAQIQAAKDKLDKDKRASALNTQLASLNGQLQKAVSSGADNVATRLLAQIDAINKKLASGNYAKGGVIGGGARPAYSNQDNTMINAQFGEGVVTLKGMAFLGANGLAAINQQQNPFPPVIVNSTSQANSGTVQVELSPVDRQLLAQAGNVTLSIDGRTIAGTTNAVNLNNARRGANG